jgi:hypothetical protein
MEMDDPDQLTPAVDPIRLLPNVIRYCLSEDDASRLALDAQLMNARFLVHQIVRLIEFPSTALRITLSATAVACAFEVGHSVVKRAQLRGYDDPPARGRYYELAADAEQ